MRSDVSNACGGGPATRRWQTKEGTYRLKGKLLLDVRDTDVEMADISTGP